MISDSRNSRQMRKLNEVTFIKVSGIRCIDKKTIISLNQYSVAPDQPASPEGG